MDSELPSTYAIRIHAGTKERLMSTSESLGNVVVIHPLDPGDASVIAQIRSATRAQKGVPWRIDARKQFDALMEAVSPRNDVTFESATVGDVPGLWVHPASSRSDGAILHLHGGWFSAGSARAYRHLVGHIAARAGVRAFIPDYRLAPEHPFPAATDDVRACYQGLAERDVHRIALTGDSAGGNLALGLASSSNATLADADPLFTRPQVAELVHSYLGSADAKQPLASPLHGRYAGMPAIRIHVGDDEVLLDDSLRYVERAVAAGVDARADVWMGMPHGFPASIGRLKAATQALDAIGAFLAERLRAHASP